MLEVECTLAESSHILLDQNMLKQFNKKTFNIENKPMWKVDRVAYIQSYHFYLFYTYSYSQKLHSHRLICSNQISSSR